MTSGMGRGTRIVLGLVILSVWLWVMQGTLGTILAVFGLIRLSGGMFDFCLIAFALGYPLKGSEARKKLAGK